MQQCIDENNPGSGRGTTSARFAGAALLATWMLFIAGMFAGSGAALEIRASGRFDHGSGKSAQHRVAVALNDDHDCGLLYEPSAVWNCRVNCPDGGCDHRALEPVWDYLYTGGRVEGEDDLLELEIVPPPGVPAGARLVLSVVSGGESLRLWPHPRKGEKREILPAEFALGADQPRRIYAEGVKVGTATLQLAVEGGGASGPYTLHVDVVRLVDSRGGKRSFIYRPGEVTLRLEPEELLRSRIYRNRIVWQNDASGKGPHRMQHYNPGDKIEGRRRVYHPQAVVNGALTLTGEVKVSQNLYCGTPVAKTTAERRREVEALAPVPAAGLMQTLLPNDGRTTYSQAWFERMFTGASTAGDPVRPVNEARLQYAPEFAHGGGVYGVACCYGRPFGVFITKKAYDVGLKREDLQALATHELHHLRHYAGVNTPGDIWNVLCEGISHEVATYFMEADAYAVTLHSNGSWRHLRENTDNFVKNYRAALDSIATLPSRRHMEAAVRILKDVYGRLPADMQEFKRPDYECYIRPPLEVDEIGG